MYSLRSVGVWSFVKMMGIIYGCLGLLVVPFFLLVGFGSLLRGGSNSFAGLALLPFAILAPIIYGAMGLVMGAVMAWIYNLAARRAGGIELELKTVAANPPLDGGTF